MLLIYIFYNVNGKRYSCKIKMYKINYAHKMHIWHKEILLMFSSTFEKLQARP